MRRPPRVLARGILTLACFFPILVLPAASARADCEPSPRVLCLLGSRFEVTARWTSPNVPGGAGDGVAVPLADKTGAFWFFAPDNYELLVKVLDGRDLNDSFWVFFGALTDVEFRLTVVDTETGERRVYENPAGNTYGVTDTGAFPPRGAFCGGIAGFPCPEGQACDLDPGSCGISDPAGHCFDIPQACPEIFSPVCGCDGLTYANDCVRRRAGAPKDHDGSCAPASHESKSSRLP